MSLGDVIAERELSNGQVAQAICALWGLHPTEVLVINDLEELVNSTQSRRVLCHTWVVQGGQFHTVLSFHEGEFTNLPRIGVGEKLSRILRCRCLLSDSIQNPYTMVLVSGNEPPKSVHLNAKKLDSGTYEVIENQRDIGPFEKEKAEGKGEGEGDRVS